MGQTVKKRRPIEDEKKFHFDQLCDWIEQEAECYTVKELHEKMITIANSETVYSIKWLKSKIKHRYKDHVFFAELRGKSDIECFKDLASLIINNS